MENPAIKALAETYLANTELMDKFRVAPAAMTLHHAFLGGLLEHTLSLMHLADAMLEHYPQLNRDIVLMGLFLHDLGKTSELTWATGFGYTDEGQLVGHIGRGLTMLHDHIRACESEGTDVPTPIIMVLEHIILSHHGKPEFGALKVPSTPEAIFISHLDDLDAKMQMALSSSRSDDQSNEVDPNETSGGNFTEKIWALDTRLYRPDPTKVVE
jgi:3'-5' exoribonuclease